MSGISPDPIDIIKNCVINIMTLNVKNNLNWFKMMNSFKLLTALSLNQTSIEQQKYNLIHID